MQKATPRNIHWAHVLDLSPATRPSKPTLMNSAQACRVQTMKGWSGLVPWLLLFQVKWAALHVLPFPCAQALQHYFCTVVLSFINFFIASLFIQLHSCVFRSVLNKTISVLLAILKLEYSLRLQKIYNSHFSRS